MASSLGRLTVDLMAKTAGIEKGTREGRKQFRELEKSVESAEKTIRVGMAAAAAATAAYAVAVVKLAKDEISLIATQDNLARSMNATVTGLRAVNKAAGDHGIDELDSSLNRLNRRLGAAERGAGPAAHAVEALGLNIRQIANADADEKLALIADAIQKNGVSANVATRYLQDFGFEQQGIYNLFRDGGDAIRANRQEIEKMGLAVSEIDAQRIQQAQTAFDGMGDIVAGIKTQLGTELAPILAGIVQTITDATNETVDFGEVVGGVVNSSIDAVGYLLDAVDGVSRSFELVGSGIAVAMLGAEAAVLAMAVTITEKPVDAINVLIDALNKIPGIDIDKLGYASFGEQIREQAILANQAFETGLEDLHEIAMRPMPSESLKKWVADVREASAEAAQATIDARLAANETIAKADETNWQEHYAKLIERYGQEIELMQESNAGAEEILLAQYQAKELALAESLAKNEITEDQFRDRSAHEWELYQQKLVNIEKMAGRARMQGAAQVFGNLSTLMNTESRKLFEIGKAAAYANTVVTTAMAAMDAYAWGMKYGGIAAPAVAAAAAGAAIIAGGVQLAAISSQKFAAGGAGVSNTQAINNAAEPVGATQQQAPVQDIYIRGIDRDSLYSGEQVLEMVNEQIRNGGRLVGFS